jgi:hypothetical protein
MYTSDIRPDTSVTIVAEHAIPYRGTEIGQLILNNGDIFVARGQEDNAVVIELLKAENLQSVWSTNLALGVHEDWDPALSYDEKSNTLSVFAVVTTDDDDSVAFQALRLDAQSGKIQEERWLRRMKWGNDSLKINYIPSVVYSEDTSKILFYYTNFQNTLDPVDDNKKSIDITFEVYDRKFTKLNSGTIRCNLPVEGRGSKEKATKCYASPMVDNTGNVYILNVAAPNKLQVARYPMGGGAASTQEASWSGVNVADEDKTFGKPMMLLGNNGNVYVAASWQKEDVESGGVVLGKFDFATMQPPIATRYDFTSAQLEKLIGDDELHNYFLHHFILHNDVVVAMLANDESQMVVTANHSYQKMEMNDVVMLGFDLQGNPIYQTVMKKSQDGVGGLFKSLNVGMRAWKTPAGIQIMYMDRSEDRLVSHVLDPRTGTLSPPKGVMEMGRNAFFVRQQTGFNPAHNDWYFNMLKGDDKAHAMIYKVRMDQSSMRTLPSKD